MKRFDNDAIHKLIIPCFILLSIILIFQCLGTVEANDKNATTHQHICAPATYSDKPIEDEYMPRFAAMDVKNEIEVTYTPLGVPDIDSRFKAYMSYKKITDKTSNQYKFISECSYIDAEGFLRFSGNIKYGIKEDCYLIALGSYYGTEIGAKYRITTDTGNVFYGVLGDCKDDRHTDSNNQYTTVGTYNIVEFIVDTDTLNKDVKYHGSANWYEPLSGNIISIEKIEIIGE